MMRASGSSFALLGASLAAFGLVIGFVAYPALRKAEARAIECGRLLGRAAQIDSATKERDALKDRVQQVQRASQTVLRSIPPTTDQATLMRMLAVETSPHVLTQVINAGESVPASPGPRMPYRAVPVSVEMIATFPEVLELLTRAEGSDRLVRAIKLTIEKQPKKENRREADWDSPFVRATLELDAVYGTAAETAGEVKP
ncbi:MAG: hypothetical protein ACK5C3_02145 [bacterium]